MVMHKRLANGTFIALALEQLIPPVRIFLAAHYQVARFFRAIKRHRAMVTCSERIARNVRASLHLVCARICPKQRHPLVCSETGSILCWGDGVAW